jgi:hypothetical protein
MPIDPSTVKWDAPAIDPNAIKWDDAPKESTYTDRLKGAGKALGEGSRDAGAGFVRGAGSIGATALAPVDYLFRKAKEAGLAPEWSIFGRDDRRQAMTDALGTLGADTNSMAFKGGKLGGEIAGTAGAGGALAGVARGAGAVPEVVNGLASGGFSLGPTAFSSAGNLATRMATGGAAGAATVGLASPDDAATGGAIGYALPGVLKGMGAAGTAITSRLAGPPLSAAKQGAVDLARQAGYKLPPTEIKPSAFNSITEGLSGKIKTSQAASERNQPITNALAAKGLGLPESTQLNVEVLDQVRKKAGMAYEAVGSTGTVRPGPEYVQSLDKITEKARTAAAGFPDGAPSPLIKVVDGLKSKQFDSASAVAKISELREQANKAYMAKDNELGKGLKAAAGALEDALDAHMKSLGVPPEMLQGFRDARELIAKTYSVQRGLNSETGNVSASALAAQLEKGKPLSGELRTIAKVGSAFPKATQALKQNHNALSPLDFATAVLSGVGHGATLLARPATRAAILSDAGQNFAARGTPRLNALAGPAAYRALPRAENLDTSRR